MENVEKKVYSTPQLIDLDLIETEAGGNMALDGEGEDTFLDS